MKCIVCGRPASEMHEIFYGRGVRQLSIDYGYQVPLCRCCHQSAHLQSLGAGRWSPLQEFLHMVRPLKRIQRHLCRKAGLDYTECVERIQAGKRGAYV